MSAGQVNGFVVSDAGGVHVRTVENINVGLAALAVIGSAGQDVGDAACNVGKDGAPAFSPLRWFSNLLNFGGPVESLLWMLAGTQERDKISFFSLSQRNYSQQTEFEPIQGYCICFHLRVHFKEKTGGDL